MGRICPILNHPLNDGVLVNDIALVKFIQKRNAEFLDTELVCRSCKLELSKLYKKKLKKAIELRKKTSDYGRSISSLKDSKNTMSSSYSSTCTVCENLAEAKRIGKAMPNGTAKNVSGTSNSRLTSVSSDKVAVSPKSIRPITSYSNTHSILQENLDAHKNKPFDFSISSNVTIRKKTIKDFFDQKTRQEVDSGHNKAPVHSNTNTELDDDGVTRRLSQQPSTSKAASTLLSKSNKRPISAIVDRDDDEDDDESLSLNAFNGTRLPHIQPIPPKRKKQPTTWNRATLDVMDKYAMDITGG